MGKPVVVSGLHDLHDFSSKIKASHMWYYCDLAWGRNYCSYLILIRYNPKEIWKHVNKFGNSTGCNVLVETSTYNLRKQQQ